MSLENSFKGKSVVITGAGKGIGRALAVRLASYGAQVHAVSRTEETLKSLKTECPTVNTLCVDLRNWEQTQNALKTIKTIDSVLNIAGVGTEEAFLEITPDTFDDIMNCNFKSLVAVSQIGAKTMITNGTKGTIVNLSSRMARKAFADCAIYSASKAAMDSITRTMALELGKHGIRVNSVNLGPTWTPMWSDTFQEGGEGRADVEAFMAKTKARLPSGEAFIPMEDVLNTILFLASDLTTMLTGENVALDGGYCIT